MTWALARQQLVTIVEGVAASSLSHVSAYGRFRHKPEIARGDALAASSRCFAIEGQRGEIALPIAGQMQRNEVTIAVVYQDDQKAHQLDEVIWSDYAAIVYALTNEANWNRPTSTISTVSTATRYDMSGETEDIEGDLGARIARRLFIRILLTHQGTT